LVVHWNSIRPSWRPAATFARTLQTHAPRLSLALNQFALNDLCPDNRYEVKLGLHASIAKCWTARGALGNQWGSQDFSKTTARLGG